MNLEFVKDILGKPYYEAPGCLIYNVDCLSAMRLLEKPFIHLTVTSPPYNIGKEYEQVRPVEDYIEWCTQWINEIYRLTTTSGAFILNLGYLEVPGRAKALPIPYLLWNRIPFYMIQEIVWHYGAGVASRKMLSPRNEKFLWYVKDPANYVFNLDDIRDKDVKYPNQKKNGKLKCNQLGKNPSDVWIFPKVTSGANRSPEERTEHPAQFPEAVVDRFIKGMSNENQIVFDPFIGSGTTAVSALRNGRRVLGFELNERYCKIAARRIDAFMRESSVVQPSLFDATQWM